MSNTNLDNTNKGALFINNKKEKDSHPTMKGSINIDGKEYWLSAWSKTHETKGKWLSISVEPKEPAQAPTNDNLNAIGDDLPF